MAPPQKKDTRKRGTNSGKEVQKRDAACQAQKKEAKLAYAQVLLPASLMGMVNFAVGVLAKSG
jgi:hypothetical protein